MGIRPAYLLIEWLTPLGWYNFTAWAINPLKTLLFNPLSAPPFPQQCELNTMSESLLSDGLVLFYSSFLPYSVYCVYGYWVYYRMDIKKGYPHFL